jgi:predicted small lipoprotein YifL
MRLSTSVGIILAFGLLLQGCGRKGPLTMPVEHKAAVPAAPVVSAASAVPATPTGKQP